MATFRKSASRTRAALESSTALPSIGPDDLDFGGDQAAKITSSAKTPKAARKSGPGSKPPIPADAGLAPPRSDATSLDGADAAFTRPASDVAAVVAEPLADAIDGAADAQTEATTVAADIVRSAESPMAEAGSIAADFADQAAHAGAQVAETVTDLAAETMADTAARTADMTSAAAAVTIPSVEAAASAVERAGTAAPDSSAAETLGELNARLADLFRVYFEDSMAFLAAITTVRSVPEAVAVNQQHFQRRLDAITAHNRDLTLLAGKLAAQAWTPFAPAVFR